MVAPADNDNIAQITSPSFELPHDTQSQIFTVDMISNRDHHCISHFNWYDCLFDFIDARNSNYTSSDRESKELDPTLADDRS